MAKTRSQISVISIKKEGQEDLKTTLIYARTLNGINTSTKTRGRIAKRETTKINNSNSLSIPGIKLEDESDNKSLLQAQNSKPKRPKEQIRNFIEYIMNSKMTIPAASRKLKMSQKTGYAYYKKYIEDPERKIPEPLNEDLYSQKTCTQEHINTFFKYIRDDKLTITESSRRSNICRATGQKYYDIYMEDPERNIPLLCRRTAKPPKRCSQEQITLLISYIMNDKMSVAAASRKVNISHSTGGVYYHSYIDDPERNIPTPRSRSMNFRGRLTQYQMNRIFKNIVDDIFIKNLERIKS